VRDFWPLPADQLGSSCGRACSLPCLGIPAAKKKSLTVRKTLSSVFVRSSFKCSQLDVAGPTLQLSILRALRGPRTAYAPHCTKVQAFVVSSRVAGRTACRAREVLLPRVPRVSVVYLVFFKRSASAYSPFRDDISYPDFDLILILDPR